MKNKIYKAILILLVPIITIVSCKKWIDPDLNIDPDSPKELTMDLLLSASQASMAYVLGGFDIVGVTSMWMKYILGIEQQAKLINDFTFFDSDVNNVWNNIYGSLNDMKKIVELSQEEGNESPYYEGIAKVLMAYTFGTATQLWGDIPFSEALQGDDNLKPKYDSQQEVYVGIQKLLDEAIIALNVDPDSNAYALDGDLIYQLNPVNQEDEVDNIIEKWLKTAYSLKMRYYLHLAKVDHSMYDTIVSFWEEDSSRFFESYTDDFEFYFGENENEKNPLYQFDEQRGDCELNNHFDSLLSEHQPKRAIAAKLWSIFLASGETFAGDFYGRKNSPVTFISHSEINFIVAEAREAIGDSIKAAFSMKNGIRSFLEKLPTLSGQEANIDAWMQEYDSKIQEAIDDDEFVLLDEIMTQKYIALFLNPETFVDWRRTGIPASIEKENNPIPRRYPYPSEEWLYNSNVPNVVSIDARNWIDPE